MTPSEYAFTALKNEAEIDVYYALLRSIDNCLFVLLNDNALKQALKDNTYIKNVDLFLERYNINILHVANKLVKDKNIKKVKYKNNAGLERTLLFSKKMTVTESN